MLPDYLQFSGDPSKILNEVLNEINPDYVAVLVDENTCAFCLPLIRWGDCVIEIKSGEINKTLATCEYIWKQMTDLGFSRKSLLINLGGGVIGDMGGFVASTYKRGIRFVNIPTTLLSQVDASIGGKTGIDFYGLKNHIGIFQTPEKVIICDEFLETLPKNQMKSGFAEVLKHALIFDSKYWEKVKNLDISTTRWHKIIAHSVQIKNRIVMQDPKENGLRKILNFGHTMGHAIETERLNTEHHLLHGEAIAVGMILEADIAVQKGLLNAQAFDELKTVLINYFTPPVVPPIESILSHLKQDKKNEGNILKFSLIDQIGNCLWDVPVTFSEIEISLNNYSATTQIG